MQSYLIDHLINYQAHATVIVMQQGFAGRLFKDVSEDQTHGPEYLCHCTQALFLLVEILNRRLG